MKTYKLICSTFGWKFSFNAKDLKDATTKMQDWCRYHSHDSGDYSVEETTDTSRMHNEYID